MLAPLDFKSSKQVHISANVLSLIQHFVDQMSVGQMVFGEKTQRKKSAEFIEMWGLDY